MVAKAVSLPEAALAEVSFLAGNDFSKPLLATCRDHGLDLPAYFPAICSIFAGKLRQQSLESIVPAWLQPYLSKDASAELQDCLRYCREFYQGAIPAAPQIDAFA